MDGDPRMQLVAAALEAIDERTKPQTDFIMAALVRGAWPGGIADRLRPPAPPGGRRWGAGGIADRLDPSASEWVRRWGPGGRPPEVRGDCSCVDGRCMVCN